MTLDTPRFHLREITADDATDRYLSWLRDAAEYIGVTDPRPARQLSDLREYVAVRAGRPDVLFLAICDKATGVHIGNIKYEPVDSERGEAVMGILIGDADYRGKGVATEVLKASLAWLREHRGIRRVALGVSVKNQAAVRVYERAGFAVGETPLIQKSHPDQIVMVTQL